MSFMLSKPQMGDQIGQRSDVAGSATKAATKEKGILRFDIIDENGWQWTVLHLDKRTRLLEVLELTEEARAAVNERCNRFSWTKDGKQRDIEDEKVLFHLDQDGSSETSRRVAYVELLAGR